MPPVLADGGLQDQAAAALTENRRYPNRKNARKYLLRGLVKCEACGAACTEHPAGKNGKTYHYYTCRAGRPNAGRGSSHKPPYLNAVWLEDLVWTDVRHFLQIPGEVLERVRDQTGVRTTARSSKLGGRTSPNASSEGKARKTVT